MLKIGSILLALLTLGGCGDLGFYAQGVAGQCRLLLARRDISAVLARTDLAPEVRRKLETVQRMRRFAVKELKLPDDNCYSSYVELDRPYVVWNLVAAPEFSLQPKTWCYPLVGCVPYRGWFSREKAESQADRLRREGYDVLVYGVDAYSSIGWFDDPVLSTFLRRDDAGLAALLFHEWAHRVIYLAGDAAFSESFAHTVEIEGVNRWLSQHGDEGDRERWLRQQRFRKGLYRLSHEIRSELEQLYAGSIASEGMAARKKAILDRFSDEALSLAARLGIRPAAWLRPDRINNASLILFGTYQDQVPAFTAMLRSLDGDFASFYRQVRAIARQPEPERRATMARWARIARESAELADIAPRSSSEADHPDS
ncbi:MAG: aminopeptidase [Geothermobacteraceae bacterium]